MVTVTTLAKKIVQYGEQRYRLYYRLVYRETKGYGIEIVCKSSNVTERECVFIEGSKFRVTEIIRLFAEETVFPIALLETLENYL
ncbi:MAG: hypothetical protein J6A61_04435 [Clostridia bacterium]|nr:hypothetical protein [Clostridia bacterium]